MSNRINVNTDGLGDLTQKFGRMNLAMKFEAKQITKKSTMRIEREAKKLAYDQGVHDTGYLIRMIKGRTYDDGLSGEVIGGADYHIYHELGTRRMPARPSLYPAAQAEKPKYVGKLAEAIQRTSRS